MSGYDVDARLVMTVAGLRFCFGHPRVGRVGGTYRLRWIVARSFSYAAAAGIFYDSRASIENFRTEFSSAPPLSKWSFGFVFWATMKP